MAKQSYPAAFLEKLRAITAKRAKTVIDHILEHGQITTEELKDRYGYNHPPRAIRDVKELGIPITQTRVIGSDGRGMAAYTFGDPTAVRGSTHSGRVAFPKAFKTLLVQSYGTKCSICFAEHDARNLQIDHRIPYEVAGDADALNVEEFMLICGSCNRAKSWSCEHCENWISIRDPSNCLSCYWASPERYTYIALQPIRRMDISWTGAETDDHDRIVEAASQANEPPPEFVKGLIRKAISSAAPKGKKPFSN